MDEVQRIEFCGSILSSMRILTEDFSEAPAGNDRSVPSRIVMMIEALSDFESVPTF
jgi:hypothetical protein